MSILRITQGALYDPANGVNGVVQDIWVQDGKVIAAPADPDVRPDKTIDATGLVVMPGGVDMHAPIAGPKVNIARKMRPEDKRKAPVVRRTPLTRSGTTGYDDGMVPDIKKWFEAYYTIQFANYPVGPALLAHGGGAVPCRSRTAKP